MEKGRMYEMLELSFEGEVLTEDYAQIDFSVVFTQGEKSCEVKGFYVGDGSYRARFLPEEKGMLHYQAKGLFSAEGDIGIEAAKEGRHGAVRVDGMGFSYANGTSYQPFGTTVYAFLHQESNIIDQTLETLKTSPFNKLRFCIFPKHYEYNENEPPFFPFEKAKDGTWDVRRPCFAYWDALDRQLLRLEELGIEADLILFHSYDRWGFDSMPQENNFIYLDYLIRRLSAYPHVWWSLANEYDLCARSIGEWEELEDYVAKHDPFSHLLSCHNCFREWDAKRKNITHASIQTKLLTKLAAWEEEYQKPVIIDECCYEGNLEQFWGSITGRELVNRFWECFVTGAYCTHGETFLDEKDIIWWAKGGTLKGESPKRIAFLRQIAGEIPGRFTHMPSFVESMLSPLRGKGKEEQDALLAERPAREANFLRSILALGEDLDEFLSSEYFWQGQIKSDYFIWFFGTRPLGIFRCVLPEGREYELDLIDTWNMTRETLPEKYTSEACVKLPSAEGIALLARAIS